MIRGIYAVIFPATADCVRGVARKIGVWPETTNIDHCYSIFNA